MAATGTWATVAQRVTDQHQEIGVRIALGALRGQLLIPMLKRGIGVALVGIIVGVILAWGATGFLESLLYQTSPKDLRVFSASAALVLGVVLLATYLPLRRATRVDPLDVLRSE